MHEMSVVNSIIKICSEEVEHRNIKKVNSIKLMVGELAGLVPECISYYFDIATKDSNISGAKLIIEKIPLKIKCNTCGYEGSADKKKFICPSCNGYKLQIKEGREFYIKSMEVD